MKDVALLGSLFDPSAFDDDDEGDVAGFKEFINQKPAPPRTSAPSMASSRSPLSQFIPAQFLPPSFTTPTPAPAPAPKPVSKPVHAPTRPSPPPVKSAPTVSAYTPPPRSSFVDSGSRSEGGSGWAAPEPTPAPPPPGYKLSYGGGGLEVDPAYQVAPGGGGLAKKDEIPYGKIAAGVGALGLAFLGWQYFKRPLYVQVK